MADTERDILSGLVGERDMKYEEEGDWFEHAPEEGQPGPNQIEGYRHKLIDANGNGLKRIKVSSRHTTAFQNASDRLGRNLLRLPQNRRAAKERENNHYLAGKHAVLDWELTNVHGEVVPFDQKLAIRIMTERQYRDYRNFAIEGMLRIEGEIDDAREEDEKN